MLWSIIFISVFVAACMGFLYLVSRFHKLRLVEKISKGNKKTKIAVSILTVILLVVVLCFMMGFINAVVCLLHLVVFWLLCDLFFVVLKKLGIGLFKYDYIGILAIAVTVMYLSVGWFLAHHVWQTHYTIETDKKVGSLRIIQFADSHVGTTFDGRGLEKYVDEMQALNPDVVLITGDFVDDDTSKEDMIHACMALGKLKTTYGIYFVFGNHDKGYYGKEYRGYSGDDLIAELKKNGVTVLQDETVLIDDRFYIIGRQDLSEEEGNGYRASMAELVKPLDKHKFIIIMDHQPHDYTNQVKEDVDLVLSGHTHGGQLFPITYAGEWIGANDKTYGYEKRNNTNFIVTSGISDWAIQFKTGCKSEFVVIDVKEK